MKQTDTTDVLNQLFVILWRSFPMYLVDARPYVPDDRKESMKVIEQLVASYKQLAQRIYNDIADRGGSIQYGEFPMEFTDLHDLSIDYLIKEAVRYQMHDIAAIGRCVDALRLSPAARALAEEALGAAKGHLESLEELQQQPA